MSNLRRYHNEGNIYFITCVTYKRLPILIENHTIFQQAINSCKEKSVFEIFAQVLLPDHFHMIIDPVENDISSIMQKIKMSFGMLYRKSTNMKSGRLWQHRFWDHIIRNEKDMNQHIDYIHYNPVKHGIVHNPFDWRHSTIHEYKEKGYYSADWGVKDKIRTDGDFGE